MDAKEFKSRVALAGRNLPAAALEQATGHYCEVYSEPFQLGQVRDAVQLAGRFAVSQAKPEDAKAESEVFDMSARDIVSSDALCDELEPEILALRHEVFGSGKIPFHSDRAAVRWIQETAARENSAWPAVDANEIQAVGARLREMTGAEVVLNKPRLPYLKPGQTCIYRVTARCDGQLYPLAKACESLSLTGFPGVSIAWWILRGVRPILPRVTFSRSLRSRGPESITVSVNGSALTWREAWPIFQEVQKGALIKARPPSPQHARIRQLVAARGGVPAGHGSKCAFWESIRSELEKEFGSKAPGTWQAVRKAYYSRNKSAARFDSLKPLNQLRKIGVETGVELSPKPIKKHRKARKP